MRGQAVNCVRVRLDRRHAIRPSEKSVSKVGRMIDVVADYRVFAEGEPARDDVVTVTTSGKARPNEADNE